jgi:triacylglycerol lipase
MVPLALLIWTCTELAIYAGVARGVFDASWPEATLGAGLMLLATRACVNAVTWSFALAYRSPAPRLSFLRTATMVVGEYLAFLLTFVVVMPFERLWMPRDRLGPSSRPLVLVHGYGCSRGVWWLLRHRLEAAGHTVASVSLAPPYASIDKLVPLLTSRIEAVCRKTGAQEVILVAHSMGGLVCRQYLARHGRSRVERLITIASPHAGSQLARIGIGANAREMTPGSQWLADLASDEYRVPTLSIRTPHDNYVMPQDNQRLTGARDVELAGIGHLAVLYARRTGDALLEACR